MTPRVAAVRVAVLALALALCACGLLKKKKGLEDGLDAATVTVTGTGAANEKDVLRYSQEDKIANELAAIAKDNTQPRTYPGLGQPVATLAKGYTVTKLAKYFSTGVLVIFDDPTTPGQKLMGWLAPEELGPLGTASTATATAAATTAPHPTGVVVAKDAGVAAAVVDAGTAPAATSTAAAPAAALFTQPGPDGKCPAGFAPAPGGCRRPCTSDSGCPSGTFCKPGGLARKFCSTTK